MHIFSMDSPIKNSKVRNVAQFFDEILGFNGGGKQNTR